MTDLTASLTVYTKPGCVYCDKAKAFLDSLGQPFVAVECQDVADLKSKLGPFGAGVTTFPFIARPKKVIGGYENLRDAFEEPLLQESHERFSAFPIEYPEIYGLYKKALASFWTAEEINYAEDANDFAKLTPNEQHFISHVLAFFAASDGIIQENLLANFADEVQISEARLFYSFQAFNEAEHSRTYSMLIEAIIKDQTERDRLFNAIVHVPAVRSKASWALKWFDTSRRFAERLVAFLCVEGILFSGSFCAIFWLKRRRQGFMPGLTLSNEFISRDEALHCDHAAALYRRLARTLTQSEVEAIVREAVEIETAFINDAVPCAMLGMSAELMTQYIQFVADRLLRDIGYAPMFNAKNSFPWMENIGLEGKSNFFERHVSEYARAGVLAESKEFSMDTEF